MDRTFRAASSLRFGYCSGHFHVEDDGERWAQVVEFGQGAPFAFPESPLFAVTADGLVAPLPGPSIQGWKWVPHSRIAVALAPGNPRRSFPKEGEKTSPRSSSWRIQPRCSFSKVGHEVVLAVLEAPDPLAVVEPRAWARCASASKENSIVFPATVLLVEIVFFSPKNLSSSSKKMVIAGGFAVVVAVFIGLIVFSKNEPLSIFDGYAGRPYTLAERLMTQPRVLLFYLSQLVYHVPSRLSIQHDITHSISLLEPWTTLPSIVLILLMIGYSISSIRKNPLLSFAFLFFILNQIVESTI